MCVYVCVCVVYVCMSACLSVRVCVCVYILHVCVYERMLELGGGGMTIEKVGWAVLLLFHTHT